MIDAGEVDIDDVLPGVISSHRRDSGVGHDDVEAPTELVDTGFQCRLQCGAVPNVGRLRHIPSVIVQGRYDVVCPMDSAWALHRAWPEAKLNVVSVNVDYWSDLRSSVFGLTKDQQGNAYVMVGSDQVYLSAIPAAEREQIIKDLLATPGAKVTEQRIAELWVLGGRQNAERDRIQAANAAEAQQTVNAAAPPSTADLQKAEEERVRGIRKLFPSPLYEEADRRRQQQKQAAELKQQRQAEEARREAERVREIRRIWGMPPAQSGGGN